MTSDHKPRKRYRLRTNTQGIKGAKLPRINMAFDPDVYHHIREQAEAENTTMTRYVNEMSRESMRQETSDHGKTTDR